MPELRTFEEKLGSLFDRPVEHAKLVAFRNLIKMIPLLSDAGDRRSINYPEKEIFLPVFGVASRCHAELSIEENLGGLLPDFESDFLKYKFPTYGVEKRDDADDVLYSSWGICLHYAEDSKKQKIERLIIPSEVFRYSSRNGIIAKPFHELDLIENGVSIPKIAGLPVWPQNIRPSWARDRWEDLRSQLLNLENNWEVWIDWYERRLDGEPFRGQIEIDRILGPKDNPFTEDDWKDPTVINKKILDLEIAWKAEQAPPEPRLDINAEGKLDYVPNPVTNQPLYEATLFKLSDTLAELKNASAKTDQFRALTGLADRMQRALNAPSPNPYVIHDRAFAALSELEDLIKKQEVSDGGIVDTLRTDLGTAIIDTRNISPTVHETLMQREAQRIRPPSARQVAALEQNLPAVREAASDIVAEDIDTGLDAIQRAEGKAPEEISDADRHRIVSFGWMMFKLRWLTLQDETQLTAMVAKVAVGTVSAATAVATLHQAGLAIREILRDLWPMLPI